MVRTVFRAVLTSLGVVAMSTTLFGAEPPRAWTTEPPKAWVCICGTGCACKAGKCPTQCPVAKPQLAAQPVYRLVLVQDRFGRLFYQYQLEGGSSAGSCPGGVCPLPRR